MLSERQLQGLLKIFEERAQALTTAYLAQMGEHLRAIGQLTPSDVNRLVELKRMGANVDWIKREIAKAMGAAARDVERVLYRVAESDYRFAAKFYGEGRQIPIKKNAALMRVLRAQARQTAGEMTNLARTTVVSGAYKDAVSAAIQAAQSGIGDYNGAIRRAVKDAAREGLRVKYESGNHRRLDTAVRMNVLDGIRQLNQDVARQTGKEFGADGVELSAHALCAEDHLPYQGLQFTNRQFDQIQALLPRPIGQWNCKHFAFPILFGMSRPAYTQDQLDGFKRNSEERITIDGITKTRYEWTQEQRRIETAIRQRKDTANLAKASGDDALRRSAQAHITRLQSDYRRVSEQAGLIERFDKARVAGFRAVKADANLTFIADDAKIKASSGLPKVLKGLPDETVKATVDVDFPILQGVVPKGAAVRSVVVMAGNGTSTPIRDLGRLYNSYSALGGASGWQKKSGVVTTDRFKYEIHWYENNGAVPAGEIKTKGVKR